MLANSPAATSFAVTPPSPPGVAHSDTHSPLAAPVYRIVAHLIDFSITMLVPCMVAFTALMPRNGALALAIIAAGCGALAGVVVVNLVMLHRHGQTLGKHLLRLRIVRTDGRRMGIARIVGLRGLLPTAGTLISAASVIPTADVAFSMVDVVAVLWLVDSAFLLSPSRRTLHDRLAGGVVIRVGGRPLPNQTLDSSGSRFGFMSS